jgi:predicted RNA-binding Zn-ribbon protein involved in translation (DUF1610 family)
MDQSARKVENCPKCGSERVHPSRLISRGDQLRRRLTGRIPYRCHACGWRGWDRPIGDFIVLAGKQWALDVADASREPLTKADLERLASLRAPGERPKRVA